MKSYRQLSEFIMISRISLVFCSAVLAASALFPAAYAADDGVAYRVVLLRHGQSQWNLEKRFTGWSDVDLTDKGRDGALEAGKLIKDAGLKIDEVQTSMLSRAIDTANLALTGMQQKWLPVTKTWRLNERCYGALEGVKREDAAKEFGDDQVKVWRRSFDVAPPALKPDDPRHPANDARYGNIDKRIIPAGESLKDVIARTGPYWTDELLPEIRSGKTVLVVGHSTGLRALSSWIDPSQTPETLQKLEIGNTTPIVYEFDKDFRIIDRKILRKPKKEEKAKE